MNIFDALRNSNLHLIEVKFEMHTQNSNIMDVIYKMYNQYFMIVLSSITYLVSILSKALRRIK